MAETSVETVAEDERAPSLVQRAVGILRERTEIVVILVLLLGTRLLTNPSVPAAIYGVGIVAGATIALHSIGLVIVYRSNRIINFAQVEMGLFGGILFTQLSARRLFLVGVRKVCEPCIPTPNTLGELARIRGRGAQELARVPDFDAVKNVPIDMKQLSESLPSGISLDDLAVNAAPGWAVQLNFWLSMAISIAVVILLSWVVYSLIVRRFSRAPRLIITVMTIGLGAVFRFAGVGILTLLGLGGAAEGGAQTFFDPSNGFPFTLSLTLDAGGAQIELGTTELVLAIVTTVILVGLAIFFARSSIGVVLRGASENPDRSQTLGVNVEGVTSVAWMIAGGLSGVAAVIAATGTGVSGSDTIVPYLAAAVVGGLVSIPVTAIAAVTIGIVMRSVSWSVRTPGFIDGLLLAIIVIVLLVQRSRRTRSDTEADGGWKSARETRPIPAELRALPVVQKWVRTLRVVGGIVVLGLPWLLSPSQTNLFTVTLVYGMIAMSLLILTGWAGQISLGQFAIAGIGAYVTAVTRLPLPFSLLVGGVVGALVAVVIGVPALRLRGLHLAISTLAFAIAVTSILLNPRYFGKALPDNLERPTLLGLNLDDQRTFFYVTLVFLGLTVASVIGMRRSRTARALIACRENEAAAQSFGINLLRARLGAFAISGFIAAFAGGVFAYSQYGVNASNFGYTQSIKMFLMVVIGGLGSIAGPLIGAAYVGFAEIVGTNLTGLPLFSDGALGIGTVLLLLFAPGGLGEVVFGIRDAMLRRVADRYRIEVPSLLADRRATGDRAPIIPMTRPGGGTIFVPHRYRADGQWSVEGRNQEALRD